MSRNKLPKETKDLYAEKYKMLMKEIKDDTNRPTDISCSCENNYTTQRNQIQYNPCEMTNDIFHRTIIKSNVQYECKHKKSQIAKAILRKKDRQSWRSQVP